MGNNCCQKRSDNNSISLSLETKKNVFIYNQEHLIANLNKMENNSSKNDFIKNLESIKYQTFSEVLNENFINLNHLIINSYIIKSLLKI